MPELPEVETVANGNHARIHGQTVVGVQTSNNAAISTVNPPRRMEAPLL